MDVTKQTKCLLNRIKQQLTTYLQDKPRELTSKRCCFYLTPQEIHIIHLNKEPGGTELLFAKSIPYTGLDDLPLIFADLNQQHDLSSTPIFWLLSPNDYQAFLIESMPVPEAEIKAALTWRMQGLIQYPIEEAVIDYLLLPKQKDSVIVSIAAKKAYLQNVITQLNAINLNLTLIDVPETAINHLLQQEASNCEETTAFLYISHSTTILNIAHQHNIAFTRHLSPTKTQKALSDELIKYFDYLQYEWQQATPTNLLIAAENGNSRQIKETLTNSLSIPVDCFSSRINGLDEKYLLPFGCAIQAGEQYAPAID